MKGVRRWRGCGDDLCACDMAGARQRVLCCVEVCLGGERGVKGQPSLSIAAIVCCDLDPCNRASNPVSLRVPSVPSVGGGVVWVEGVLGLRGQLGHVLRHTPLTPFTKNLASAIDPGLCGPSGALHCACLHTPRTVAWWVAQRRTACAARDAHVHRCTASRRLDHVCRLFWSLPLCAIISDSTMPMAYSAR